MWDIFMNIWTSSNNHYSARPRLILTQSVGRAAETSRQMHFLVGFVKLLQHWAGLPRVNRQRMTPWAQKYKRKKHKRREKTVHCLDGRREVKINGVKRQRDREALQQERTEREEHVKQSTSAFQPDRLFDGLTFWSHFFFCFLAHQWLLFLMAFIVKPVWVEQSENNFSCKDILTFKAGCKQHFEKVAIAGAGV